MCREFHWAHEIFSSLDWSEMSAHPGRAFCSLALRVDQYHHHPIVVVSVLSVVSVLTFECVPHRSFPFTDTVYIPYHRAFVIIHQHSDARSFCNAGSGSHIPAVVESSELLVLLDLWNSTAIVTQNDLSSVQTFTYTDIYGSVLSIWQLPVAPSSWHSSSALVGLMPD